MAALTLCRPGSHAFGKVTGTAGGVAVGIRVVCGKCGLTFEQVMERSPEDLKLYRDWLAAGMPG